MNNESFSRRYGVGPSKQPLPQEKVPNWVRGEFEHHLHQHLDSGDRRALYEALRPLIWKVTGAMPPDGHMDFWEIWGRRTIQDVLNRCDWWEFFEICEMAYSLISRRAKIDAELYQFKVNRLFAYDPMAWQLEGGEIVPVRQDEITSIFEKAKGLLADTKYVSPNEHFSKANGHLNEKPTPDTENRVKDAVGALEGLARIVTGQPKETLGGLLKKGVWKSSLPTHLHGVIEKLWVYRSGEPGVGHAKIDPSTVGF